MEAACRNLRVVLLVDDDARLLRAWRLNIRCFSSSPIRILETQERASALALTKSEKPDLAIVDQHLSDGLGTDLLPDLRTCAPRMLMILTSADPTREDARRAGSNVVTVIPKPKTWEHYFRAIEAGTDLELIPEQPATLSLDAIAAVHISRVLRAHRNNVSAAARVLEMDRSGLQRKLVKLGYTSERLGRRVGVEDNEG